MNIYGQVAVIRLKYHLMRSFCTEFVYEMDGINASIRRVYVLRFIFTLPYSSPKRMPKNANKNACLKPNATKEHHRPAYQMMRRKHHLWRKRNKIRAITIFRKYIAHILYQLSIFSSIFVVYRHYRTHY